MMVLYDMKNWASSIMGPSRVVFYKVKNWVSSFTGPSMMMCVKWMAGPRHSSCCPPIPW